jgi:hypothetical protein
VGTTTTRISCRMRLAYLGGWVSGPMGSQMTTVVIRE